MASIVIRMTQPMVLGSKLSSSRHCLTLASLSMDRGALTVGRLLHGLKSFRKEARGMKPKEEVWQTKSKNTGLSWGLGWARSATRSRQMKRGGECTFATEIQSSRLYLITTPRWHHVAMATTALQPPGDESCASWSNVEGMEEQKEANSRWEIYAAGGIMRGLKEEGPANKDTVVTAHLNTWTKVWFAV